MPSLEDISKFSPNCIAYVKVKKNPYSSTSYEKETPITVVKLNRKANPPL